MANIVLKDVNGNSQTYQNVSSIVLKDNQNKDIEFVEKDSGGQYLVQVIDYDGTVLKQDHLDTGATFTLPDAPTNHSKLVFQEWSSPVTISDNTITVGNSDITIGATYKTASGLTEIDIELTKPTGLEVTCRMSGNKNWGDGITDNKTVHTYADYGKYTITCDGTSVPNGNGALLGMFGGSVNYFCKEVRIGENVTTLGSYSFGSSISLTSITIPNSVTSIGINSFSGSFSLKSITIPSSVTSLAMYTFKSCYSLKSIAIPNSVTNINSSAISLCYSLKSLTIPNSVTNIQGNSFQSLYCLTSITIPNSVTNIQDNSFQNLHCLTSIIIPNSVTSLGNDVFSSCRSIIKFDFTSSTVVPTFSDTNPFSPINKLCKIYVPDALYDDWIVATNWVTIADYIYKASEMED